jgi:hypothetical protein
VSLCRIQHTEAPPLTAIQQNDDDKAEEGQVEDQTCKIETLLGADERRRYGVSNTTATTQTDVRVVEEALVHVLARVVLQREMHTH